MSDDRIADDDRPLRPGDNPLADQLIEENTRLRRERNDALHEIERLHRSRRGRRMTHLRAAYHEVRCAECRVTWKSWAQRLVGIKAGYSPGAHNDGQDD